jgi:DNA-binding NarL/FixJ family response regulator
MEAFTPSSPAVARVLIVDDHPVVRVGYVELINHQAGLSVCGEAADAEEAIQQIQATHPDLVVIDISLKGSNGLDLIRQIKARWPELKTLVVSAHDESLFAERGLRAGAKGYVSKEATTDRLIEAIRRVLRGEVYLSGTAASRVMQRAVTAKSRMREAPIETLSDRELQVFQLIGQGCTTREIAQRIEISPKTVENYRENIKKKLDLRNSAELVRHAVQFTMDAN